MHVYRDGTPVRPQLLRLLGTWSPFFGPHIVSIIEQRIHDQDQQEQQMQWGTGGGMGMGNMNVMNGQMGGVNGQMGMQMQPSYYGQEPAMAYQGMQGGMQPQQPGMYMQQGGMGMQPAGMPQPTPQHNMGMNMMGMNMGTGMGMPPASGAMNGAGASNLGGLLAKLVSNGVLSGADKQVRLPPLSSRGPGVQHEASQWRRGRRAHARRRHERWLRGL